MNLETDIVVSECPCVDLRVEVRLEFGLHLEYRGEEKRFANFAKLQPGRANRKAKRGKEE